MHRVANAALTVINCEAVRAPKQEKIIAIIGVIVFLIAVLLVGGLDQDGYIEVNSTKKVGLPVYQTK